METDEIRITTSREIKVCEAAIRKLEKAIGAMEEKYHTTTAAFLRDQDLKDIQSRTDLVHWRDCCHALEQWRERLSAHRQIMNM
jgi:hypothetical protein